MIHLFTNPVLIVEVVDSVQEGRLLALFRVRTVEVKGFSFLIADRIGSRIIKGVIVPRQVVVVDWCRVLRRLDAIRKFVPESFRLIEHILVLHLQILRQESHSMLVDVSKLTESGLGKERRKPPRFYESK